MPIPLASRTPRLLLRNGSPIILAEAAASESSIDPLTGTSFRALGYRQTLVSAAKGGKANANGFRFRNGGMRAMARTFRGKAFIGGHDWGDPRARGGTIEDAYAEEMPGDVEMAMYFDIALKAPWAIEAKNNGTIDRFSIGASGEGEAMCTVHGVPLWSISECWCWPGETVENEDGQQVVAEIEWEAGTGLELSAVNVPAVDGTGIIEQASFRIELAADHAAEIKALERAVGRSKQWDRRPSARVSVAVPEGVSTPARAPITMASQHEARATMDRALICKSLGLPITATDEQILAKLQATSNDAAQVDVLRTQLADATEREAARVAELDAAHVEAEVTRLKTTRLVSEKLITSLRTAAKASRASFDSSLALVEDSAPLLAPAAGATRGELQSDEKAAANPGAAIIDLEHEGPDAFEANRSNPNMGRLMRIAAVSSDDVRKHGSRTFNVLPTLRELADNTAARGDRPGVGK